MVEDTMCDITEPKCLKSWDKILKIIKKKIELFQAIKKQSSLLHKEMIKWLEIKVKRNFRTKTSPIGSFYVWSLLFYLIILFLNTPAAVTRGVQIIPL